MQIKAWNRRLLAYALACVLALQPAYAAAAGVPGQERPAAPPQEPAVSPAAPEENSPALTLETPSVVLMEARTGKVLFAKNAHERRSPASVTKVMTLVIAFDALRDGKVKLEDKVTGSAHAASMGGTQIYLEEGESFTLGEMLTAVAVGSANDAAVAVAEHIAGSHEQFVAQMNAKAKELGMNDTQFQNATGLDADGHYMSAYDMAVMSRYAVTNYPELVKLTSIYRTELKVPHRKNGPVFGLDNRNKLVRFYPGADGLKTGWTTGSGYCIAATALKDGTRMIAALMGAPSYKVRQEEAAKLLNFGFSNYMSQLVAKDGQSFGQVPVVRGVKPQVEAVIKGPFLVSVARGETKKLATEVRLQKMLMAPVAAGSKVGELAVTLDGEPLTSAPLVAAADVAKASFFGTIGQYLSRVFRVR